MKYPRLYNNFYWILIFQIIMSLSMVSCNVISKNPTKMTLPVYHIGTDSVILAQNYQLTQTGLACVTLGDSITRDVVCDSLLFIANPFGETVHWQDYYILHSENTHFSLKRILGSVILPSEWSQGDIVSGISIMNSYCQTEKGVRVGSTFRQLRRHYKQRNVWCNRLGVFCESEGLIFQLSNFLGADCDSVNLKGLDNYLIYSIHTSAGLKEIFHDCERYPCTEL